MDNWETDNALQSIAIIGMAGRFPGAKNVDEFWQNLRNGVESISFFTDEELATSGVEPALFNDPNYVKANGALSDIEMFDASFFGFTPREAEVMDPQHRLFLECAWEALENAGYNSEVYDGQIGVYAGAEISSYLLNNLISHPDLMQSMGRFQFFINNDKDFVATRVSYKLNLRGASINISNACSTSLVAVQMACQSLLNYQSDMVLAGGVSVGVPQNVGYLYKEGMIYSPDGHCRVFDERSQGTIGGNGVGIVVLKRLTEAIADGDYIHAIIKGSAINNDGSLKVGYTAPSVNGQAAVISEAQSVAEVDPETITYIEAHGTGTALGDPIEIAALTQAFSLHTQKKGFCAIGSVKSNIGHLGAAAGITGLIKTVLALKHKLLPPSLHFEKPSPKIDFANSPFYVNTTLREWQTNGTPRRAGVSSFGIGGTNAHVILEEAPIFKSSDKSLPWHLLLLSAKTKSALEHQRVNLAVHLKQHPDISLGDVAYTLSLGRRDFSERQILVCQDIEDAVTTLLTQDSPRLLTQSPDTQEHNIVFMFSGQGAQYVNMGRELYELEPTFRQQVDLCSELLIPQLGIDLRHVLYPSEEETDKAAQQLQQTAITQPALFVIEYALAQLWMDWGIHPVALIGHSIGEYVAATLAGVFSLEDALNLVTLRGQMMQQLPPGAMLAVPLTPQEVESLLGEELSLAAINAPSLCVVSGITQAVDALANKLVEEGVECRRLHTSHAFHSHTMDSILAPFTLVVKQVSLKPPKIKYISNLTGTWITDEQATDPNYWSKQLRSPVLFAEGVQQFFQEPQPILLEVGPGQTLSALVKRHPDKATEQIVLSTLRHPQESQSDVAFLLTSLGKLWLAGVQINWSKFYTHQKRHRLPLPTYPFERQRYWIEPQKQAVKALDATSLRKKTDIADWFYVPSWKRSLLGTGEQGSRGSRGAGEEENNNYSPTALNILVFVDESGLGSQLVKKLEAQGHDVITVRVGLEFRKLSDDLYTLNPQQSHDYNALVHELKALNKTPNKIVHLWSVTSELETGYQGLEIRNEKNSSPIPSPQSPVPSPQSPVPSPHLGFYSLLFLAQSLGKQNITDEVQITVISNNVQEVTGVEVLSPEKATILGTVKVIPQEYPNIRCSSIDVILPDLGSWQEQKIVNQLLQEIQTQSPDVTIAYRGLHRWVQIFEPLRLDKSKAATPRLKQGGVYLITGGLGAIGMVLAKHLAETVQPKLVLIGHSNFPPVQEWEQWLSTHDVGDSISRKIRKIQELEKLGAEVLVIVADVANQQQMQTAIAKTNQRFGAIHGVIHAAGNIGEITFRAIAETSYTECEQQFRPKIQGLLVLNQVLQAEKELEFCVLLSSLSSVLGGLGFAAYSAANIFMDAFAGGRYQTNSVPWISINWDGWDLQAEKKQQSPSSFGASVDEFAIAPQEGVKAFQQILSWGESNQVIVSTGDLQARINQWLKIASIPKPENLSALHSRPKLPNSYIPPRNELEQDIAVIWQQLFGIEKIGIHDNFFELGGHSLLATQVLSRLRQDCCVDLPLRHLFSNPTIAELAQQVLTQQLQQAELEALEQILGEVDNLSDEEVKQQLLN